VPVDVEGSTPPLLTRTRCAHLARRGRPMSGRCLLRGIGWRQGVTDAPVAVYSVIRGWEVSRRVRGAANGHRSRYDVVGPSPRPPSPTSRLTYPVIAALYPTSLGGEPV